MKKVMAETAQGYRKIRVNVFLRTKLHAFLAKK